MTRKRKTIAMIVEVSVPASARSAEVRGAIRLAIANGIVLQPHMSAGAKLRSVKPADRIIAAARMADQAWGVAKAVRAKPPKPGPVTPLLAAMGEK